MKFELQKSEIQKIAAEHNYSVNNVEKVIRLSFILDDFVERTIRISPLFYNIFLNGNFILPFRKKVLPL